MPTIFFTPCLFIFMKTLFGGIKMKKLISIMLTAALFTACAKTPENVKQRHEQLESTPEVQTSASCAESSQSIPAAADSDFASLEQIRSQLSADVSRKYGTITVKHASVGEAKSMPTYKIDIGACRTYDLDKTAKTLFADEYAASVKKQITGRGEPAPLEPFERTDDGYEIKRVYPSDQPIYDHTFIETGKGADYKCVSLTSDGHMSGGQAGQNEFEQYYYAAHQGNVKMLTRLYPQYDDISDKSYKMLDSQQWKLADAVKYVEEFANRCLAPCDTTKFTHKVRSVGISQWEDRHGYYFELVCVDENGCVYDSDRFAYEHLQKENIYNGKSFVIPREYTVECFAKQQITRYFKSCAYKLSQKICDNDKLLTLEGAMNRLRKELAEYIDLDFESADLCFVIECSRYPSAEQPELVGYDESYCFKTCELTVRPYWCFKQNYNKTDLFSGTENAYYVNAVTGEIHIMANKGNM